VVYRATDTRSSGRHKVLPKVLLRPERVVRFEREAKALAALIIPISPDLAGSGDAQALTELVDGEDSA
jgi:hypothetical protein